MAKSLRSKWRRKCRAVKRVRYGEKELARLKKTLCIDENGKGADSEMKDITEIATVVDAKTIKEQAELKEENSTEDLMDVDNKRVYNKKTMLDQFGNYPVWMHRRQIVRVKKGRAKAKKATSKPTKHLSRKQKNKKKKTGSSEAMAVSAK